MWAFVFTNTPFLFYISFSKTKSVYKIDDVRAGGGGCDGGGIGIGGRLTRKLLYFVYPLVDCFEIWIVNTEHHKVSVDDLHCNF